MINYNTFALTKAAIESVFEKTEGITYELILVDNNSPDGSGQQLNDYFGKKINYIQSGENIGFGRANNLGFEHAKGRNIFLLNPDTLLLNNAVKILSDYLDANPKVGVCGGNLYDENMRPTHSFSRCLPSFFLEINNLFGKDLFLRIKYGKNIYFNYTEKPLDVAYITGADMMIRKEVLSEVGDFDPDFFLYYEETELTHRVKKAEYKIHSVPEAKIIHFESKSISENKIKLMLEGRDLYYKKTHNVFFHGIVNVIYMTAGISRILFYILFPNKTKRDGWIVVVRTINEKIRTS